MAWISAEKKRTMMNKKKKSADTIAIGGFCIRCIKEGLTENGCFLIVLRVFSIKKLRDPFLPRFTEA